MSDKNEINEGHLPKNYGPKATVAQILATLAQSFLLIGLGMELSMPTIVIQDLYKNPNRTFSLTLTEISWYGSILFVFHPFGSILSGFAQEKFGRKRCMIFANIPSVLGWITLHYADSSFLLFASTVLMGLSVGFSEAPILSYVGEITEPRLRGTLASLSSTGGSFGATLLFILGYFFEWRTVALLSASCPIICICLVSLIPESPIWLASKGKSEQAEEALCWLRGWAEPERVRTEHRELIRYTEVSGINDSSPDDDGNKLFAKLAEFKSPSVYRPLRLLMIIFFASIITCLAPARSFFGKIFIDLGILENQSLILAVSALLQNISCLIVVLCIHRVGKRLVALTSYSINTILIFSLGFYVVALKKNYIVSTPWIPTTIICGIYTFGTCVILLPWILLSEIFPNKSRAVATGLCAGLSYLLLFILTKSFMSVENFLTLEYTLILFGSIGFIGSVYLYFYLPDTESKSLLDIEKSFL